MVMDAVGKITGLFGGNKQAAPAQGGRLDYMIVTKGTASYNTEALVLAAVGAVGVKTLIWEYMVEAQAAYRWGFGRPEIPGGKETMGYWNFVIMDATTDFGIGEVDLCYNNHRRSGAISVITAHDSMTHGGNVTSLATALLQSKDSMIACPEGGLQRNPAMVGQDSYLQIWYTKHVAATVADHVGFTIPVTAYP